MFKAANEVWREISRNARNDFPERLSNYAHSRLCGLLSLGSGRT